MNNSENLVAAPESEKVGDRPYWPAFSPSASSFSIKSVQDVDTLGAGITPAGVVMSPVGAPSGEAALFVAGVSAGVFAVDCFPPFRVLFGTPDPAGGLSGEASDPAKKPGSFATRG